MQGFYSWVKENAPDVHFDSLFSVTASRIGHLLVDGEERSKWLSVYVNGLRQSAHPQSQPIIDWAEGFLIEYDHYNGGMMEHLLTRLETLAGNPAEKLTLLDVAFITYAQNYPYYMASGTYTEQPNGDIITQLDAVAKAGLAWIEMHEREAGDRFITRQTLPYALSGAPDSHATLMAVANATHEAVRTLRTSDSSLLALDYHEIAQSSQADDIRARIQFELDHLASGDLLPPAPSVAA